MRTIVLSDVHGEPELIRRVLDHSAYRPGDDRLIFAGDAIEVGRDSAGCLDLLAEIGAECLVGNHEYAAFVGWPLEADDVEPSVADRVAQVLESGDWSLTAEADDVLITHAGVSQRYADEFENAGRRDVARFAAALNEEFAGAVTLGMMATEGVVDEFGPLWYRPDDGPRPLVGVVQVVGHTPPELIGGVGEAQRWSAQGFYLVDPNVRGWRGRGFGEPAPIRYAVIEDGAVRVVQGSP